jgi:predicted transposase YbfD/YdcC
VPELLRSLELAGCIVRLDTMGCQRRIAREIIEADADYVLALKGKQPAAQEEISAFLDDAIERKQPALDYSADSQGTELNGAKIRPVWVVLRRRCFGAGDCPLGVWAG